MVNTLKDTFLLLPNTCRNYHVSLSHEFCNWKYCKHFSRDNFYLFVEFELKIDKINEVYKFVSKEIFLKALSAFNLVAFPHYYGSIKKQRRLYSERYYFTSNFYQILKTWLNQLILTNSLFLVFFHVFYKLLILLYLKNALTAPGSFSFLKNFAKQNSTLSLFYGAKSKFRLYL